MMGALILPCYVPHPLGTAKAEPGWTGMPQGKDPRFSAAIRGFETIYVHWGD
jgi:hypothetical protein